MNKEHSKHPQLGVDQADKGRWLFVWYNGLETFPSALGGYSLYMSAGLQPQASLAALGREDMPRPWMCAIYEGVLLC